MSDVFALLPNFQFRGKKYPLAARSVGFAHEAIAHVIQYRDNAIIEQTGAQNLTFTYSIPMREDIARGPYKSLFTQGLPALFRDMRNREEGELIDPVLGHFTVVPTSFSEETDVDKRDGTDVRVEFKQSPSLDEDQEPEAPSLQGVLAKAGRFDDQIKRANWQQQPSPRGTTDILSAVNGLLSLGDQARDRVRGTTQDLLARCEKIEATVDRTTDPANWMLRAEARRLRADILTAGAFGQHPLTPKSQAVTKYRQPLSAVAAANGMTVEQMLALNPQLAASPMVPAGTTIRVPIRV